MTSFQMKSTVSPGVGGGSHPTITMNKNFTIVAGWSSTESSDLSCRVGVYSNSTAPSAISWGDPDVYDGGDQATLAINDSGYVVSVHRSSTESNNLFYRLGITDQFNKTIAWGDSIQFNAGTDAFVAVNENVAVVVWSSTNTTNLYYSVGVLDKNNLKISWSSGAQYDSGLHPSVSISADNTVVLGHASSNSTNLYYQLGYVSDDYTQLMLGSVIKYDNGDSNDLTINDSSFIWESHKSSNDDTAFYKLGNHNTRLNSIDWYPLTYTNDHTDTICITTLQPLSSQAQIGMSIRLIDKNIDVVMQEITQTA